MAATCFRLPIPTFLSVDKNMRTRTIKSASVRRRRPQPCSSRLEQLIIEGQLNPQAVNATALVASIRAPEEDISAALQALARPLNETVAVVPALLDPSQCECLRRFADATFESQSFIQSIDAMDRVPQWRIELSRSDLEEIIGPKSVAEIWSLPGILRSLSTTPTAFLGGAALRRYRTFTDNDSRSSLGFHVDSSAYTANICLSPPDSHTGGSLHIAAESRLIKYASRGEGDATVHIGEVVHGVERVVSGERYSLLVFFQRPGFLFQRDKGRRLLPASRPM